jgi:hypothetical protein
MKKIIIIVLLFTLALLFAACSENINESPHGDWPTAENTGPSGTLTPYSGNFTADTDGQIVENLDIDGKIFIKANNVTIRNCQFSALDIAAAETI